MIEFMAITNDIGLGTVWHRAGIDRIMIDLEKHGKAERQRLRDTVKSDHSISDLRDMRGALPDAHLVVRCEPTGLPDWGAHVEAVLAEQPTTIMLPMVESVDDVRALHEVAAGRVQRVIMIETAAALAQVEAIVASDPEATFFVGLNDLHIQLGQRFLFEPVADGTIDRLAAVTKRFGARFGFGGLARPGRGQVDSADVLKEHVRVGSSLAILARSFFNTLDDPLDADEIRAELDCFRRIEFAATERGIKQVEADRVALATSIDRVAESMGTTA